MKQQTMFKIFVGLAIFVLIAAVSVGFVAVHFISKYW
jgi:hypothetical protein